MTTDQQYQQIFGFASAYLAQTTPEGIDLHHYLHIKKSFTDLAHVFEHMLDSAQNRNMLPGVIQFWDRSDDFREILFDFNPLQVLAHYDADSLFAAFNQHFPVKNATSPRNLWRMFAHSTISIGEFLSNFQDATAFDAFVMNFARDKITRAALPMLIEKEIYGFGFALACDFLKELGYTHYPKPDDHLMDVFNGLGLCPRDQYQVYKAIIEMADAVDQTAYYVDKTIWLICSGNYYLDGIDQGSKSRKEDFIEASNQNIDLKRLLD